MSITRSRLPDVYATSILTPVAKVSKELIVGTIDVAPSLVDLKVRVEKLEKALSGAGTTQSPDTNTDTSPLISVKLDELKAKLSEQAARIDALAASIQIVAAEKRF